MPIITFDLTGAGADVANRDLTIAGVTMSVGAVEVRGPTGAPLTWNNFGLNGFSTVEGNTSITQNLEGLGARTSGSTDGPAISGANPDEMLTFSFSDDVSIVSVDLAGEANPFNPTANDQRYRLVTDADNDGTLDTMSRNLRMNDGDDVAIGVDGSVFGLGVQSHVDSYYVTSITISIPDRPGVTMADAFTVSADDTATPLDVIANDDFVTQIVSIDTDLDDDGTADLLGTVTLAADGSSVSYDPNGAFADLPVGETVTETFTYTAIDERGDEVTETVEVDVEGTFVEQPVQTTFDLTGADTNIDSFQITQDGLTMTLEANHFARQVGRPVGFNESGTGIFALSADSVSLTRTDNGLGALTAGEDAEMSFGGDTPDEMLEFGFDQAVRIVSIDFVTEANAFNPVTGNQRYRLFTDTDNNDELDTISGHRFIGNGDDVVIDETGTVFGVGAQRVKDSFYVSSITVEFLTPSEADDDTATVLATAGETTITVLDNDSDIIEVTAVDPTGLLGTVTVAADGQSVSYDPGMAFADLPVGQTATETFTYDATGDDGATRTATVVVTVEGQATSASADDVATIAGDADDTTIAVLDNDSLITSITSVDTDLDDDGTSDVLGTVSVAADGQSVVYNPGTAFIDLEVGETATETFTYDATGADGETRTATVDVTIDGAAVYQTITLDLTGDEFTTGPIEFWQNGVRFVGTSMHVAEAYDPANPSAPDWLEFDDVGTGIFELFQYADPTQNNLTADGFGVLNQAPVSDQDSSIDGFGSDEVVILDFEHDVRFVSADLVPTLGNFNPSVDGQTYRLFTDTSGDGALDTVSINLANPNDADEDLNLTDDIIGFGVQRPQDSYRVKSVTVEVNEIYLNEQQLLVSGQGEDLMSFSTQDQGEAEISFDETAVTLTNNAWKSVAVDTTITADTVLSFDFKSDTEGEIHAIGFTNGDDFTNDIRQTIFQLDGRQTYGRQAYDDLYTTGSGEESYSIDVGNYFTGDFDRMVFIMDDDAGLGGDSVFSNIVVEDLVMPIVM